MPTPDFRAARTPARRPPRAPRPRTPNQVGRPGRSATPQNSCSTPSSVNASFTWSCGPTETPPQTTATSASSARSRASRVAPGSSGHRSLAITSAPAPRARAGIVCAFELRTPPGRIGSSGRQQLVAGADQRQPRTPRARGLRHAERREHAQLGRAEHGAGPQDRVAGTNVLARPADVAARGGVHLERDLAVPLRDLLDADHGVGALGQDAAGRDPERLAGPQRPARPARRRGTPRRHAASPATRARRRRCRRHGPRSRPSPSCRSRGRPRARPPRPRAPAPAPGRAAPARPRAVPSTRASTASRASATEIGSPTPRTLKRSGSRWSVAPVDRRRDTARGGAGRWRRRRGSAGRRRWSSSAGGR